MEIPSPPLSEGGACALVPERIAAARSGSIDTLADLKHTLTLLDLTSLEGSDTPAKVSVLCRKAIHPHHTLLAELHCAAVCVYPNLVPSAVEHTRGSKVRVASVAGAFPSGASPLPVKLLDVQMALDAGAHEIDMVIDRGAFLAGDFGRVFEEIAAIRACCKPALLKVILETGELQTEHNVHTASHIAMQAGADFIKTSTGKIPQGASLASTLVMLEAIAQFHAQTGRRVGFKAAGGIRTWQQALNYLELVRTILGDPWLGPDLFRLGASTLADDLIAEITRRTE